MELKKIEVPYLMDKWMHPASGIKPNEESLESIYASAKAECSNRIIEQIKEGKSDGIVYVNDEPIARVEVKTDKTGGYGFKNMLRCLTEALACECRNKAKKSNIYLIETGKYLAFIEGKSINFIREFRKIYKENYWHLSPSQLWSPGKAPLIYNFMMSQNITFKSWKHGKILYNEFLLQALWKSR